jgi:hypothetical protein
MVQQGICIGYKALTVWCTHMGQVAKSLNTETIQAPGDFVFTRYQYLGSRGSLEKQRCIFFYQHVERTSSIYSR